MKKLTLVLFSIFLMAFVDNLYAQRIKPEFNKFILVSYRPSGSGNKRFIRIEDYLEINSNGILHYAVNNFKGSYYGDLVYKGDMADTTYAAPDSIIAGLNSVFADGNMSDRQLASQKMPEGAQFAGPFEFVSYTDVKDVTHNFIIVGSSAESDIKDIVDKMWHLRFPRFEHLGVVYRNKSIEALILKFHNAAKNTPTIAAPPSLMELKIGPPPKQ